MKKNSINADELNKLDSIEWASKNRIPLQGILEITNICNFKCVHCYITNTKNQKPIFLSYDIIKSAIDEVCEMGCKIITLTGGECMLHPDFEKIYSYIWKKGIKVNIFTNASLITDEIVSLFKKYIPECVEISLYGASEHTYKEVTKSTHYADVIKGIELLQNNGFKLRLKIIVLKQNEHELEDMKRLACKYNTNNQIRISNDLMPSYDFSLDVLNNHSHIVNSTNSKNNPRTNEQAFNCYAGRSFFCINFEGNVTLCSFCSFSAMSLKKYSFQYIWETFGKSIDLPIPKDSKCYNCTFLSKCINCPARTWMFNQKIGLYPIPQCKYNTCNKIKGVNLMKNSKKILPETFVTVNGINYFRLEDGKVAVETTKNVTIDVSDKETVNLITLKCKEKEVKFWEVNDKIYALASSSYVTIPEDSTFDDLYFSKNYPDGGYVKYTSSDNCGILYISETEVSVVISHEKNYTKIDFENGSFYAKARDGKNKYHVIAESGKQLGEFPSEYKRVEGYMLFYNESKIFNNSTEFEIPGGITSVEVINNKEITFVKVVTSKGIYYYTKEISLILGPIQKEEIIFIDKKSCYIHEVVDGKIIKVFYIEFKADTYICKSLSCDKGIDVFCMREYSWESAYRFFATKDKKLYAFKSDFVLLIKDIDAETFTFYYKFDGDYDIVAYSKNKPIYWACYNMSKNKLTDSCILDVIGSGFEKGTNICKKKNEILVIDKSGKRILSTTGENCYKKIAHLQPSWRNPKVKTSIYIIEKGNNEIELYKSNGEHI